MNRTMRLLVTGAGLIAGVTFMAGPAFAAEPKDCCIPVIPIKAPDFGAPAGGTAVTVAVVPERNPEDEVVITPFISGPWFPDPVGLY